MQITRGNKCVQAICSFKILIPISIYIKIGLYYGISWKKVLVIGIVITVGFLFQMQFLVLPLE